MSESAVRSGTRFSVRGGRLRMFPYNTPEKRIAAHISPDGKDAVGMP